MAEIRKSSSQIPECPICSEEIMWNKNIMDCPFCEFICCRDCLKDFFLLTSIEFRCMNISGYGNVKSCGQRWTVKHTWKLLGKWLNDPFVKDARRELLLNRELGRKQEYMPFVVREKERQDLEKERDGIIEKLKAERPAEREREKILLSQKIRVEKDIGKLRVLREKLEILRNENDDDIRKAREKLRLRKLQIEGRFEVLASEGFADKNTEMGKSELLCNCPYDSCKGMISAFDLKCNLCKKDICGKCWEPVEGTKHSCNPEILKNVEQIKKDTKPCPNCRTRAHKIEGCNNFFCTICGASWDWLTGNFLDERWNTNPHLVDWKRNGKKLLEEKGFEVREGMECEYRPNMAVTRGKVPGAQRIENSIHKIEDILAGMTHEKYTLFAVRYYLGVYDKHQYGIMLLSHYDLLEKEKEVSSVLGTWCEVAKAILVDLDMKFRMAGGCAMEINHKDIYNADFILTSLAKETSEIYDLKYASYWKTFGKKYYVDPCKFSVLKFC